MSDACLIPESVDELRALVAKEERVLAVGNRSKPPLSVGTDATLVSLSKLQGILQYEPSEFTFTARAGTQLTEIGAALGEKQQYLPFDPMLVGAGATIGGTVAAGLAGPGRFRYGGIRDFLLGVKFVSSDSQLITAGGKVVKNSAGFDIPKFLVGSLGRFGIMTEMTFKVFPKPPITRTLSIECPSHLDAIERMSKAASSRWEVDAIDYRPDAGCVYLRLAGPQNVVDSLSNEVRSTWGSDVTELASPDAFWASVVELSFAEGCLEAIKVPTTPDQFLKLQQALESRGMTTMHWSVAGGVLWILTDSCDRAADVDSELKSLNMPGVVVRGACRQPRIGTWATSNMETAVQAAMDPREKYPSW